MDVEPAEVEGSEVLAAPAAGGRLVDPGPLRSLQRLREVDLSRWPPGRLARPPDPV